MNCLHPFWLNKLGFYVPCGRCLACKVNRTNLWANRLVAERQYWNDAAFVTLTYEDVFLPYSLNPAHLQKYFKRLRRDLDGRKIKFFACGEYGDKLESMQAVYPKARFGRPHYHAIIFGVSPIADREILKENWPYADWNALELTKRGRKAIGDVTFGSCHYVAGYVQKKLIGKKAAMKYAECGVIPPFVRMSKGIALKFVEENKKILSETLTFSYGGYKTALPKYFRDKLQITPEQMKMKHYLDVAHEIGALLDKHPWLKTPENAARALELKSHSSFNKDYNDSVYQRELDLQKKIALNSERLEFDL